MILLTIPGTWADRNRQDWWKHGSAFWQEAERNGFAPMLGQGPFWDQAVEGIIGPNASWIQGGRNLNYFLRCHLKDGQPYCIAAHSHGWHVGAYALSWTRQSPVCAVSIGTPVRFDMWPIYRRASENCGRWVHLYGRRDPWQIAGSFFDGFFGFRRRMPFAENLCYGKAGHESLLSPSLWTRHRMWDLMKSPSELIQARKVTDIG